ncbi:hypothetical protein [Amycolatopsis pittospori]|uniref:hypothetical protein n=1 Tax=Amycolatopsis pittospori TaxID=2749434 RepID=UPI001F1E33D4|nr:hypothetical protein [Amycolatopsis pittospori]
MPEWIATEFSTHPVLCLLTPDYVRRFGNGDNTSARKGVLFESRLLLQRIYDHTSRTECPVIPIAISALPVDLAPVVLKNLIVSRFDPETGEGLAAIEGRLHSLPSLSTRPKESSKVSKGVVLARKLEAIAPSSSDALTLVTEWLNTVPSLPHEDVARALPAVEIIVKATGDVSAMERVADCCLQAMSDSGPLIGEVGDRAWLLLHCRAWQLHRRHELVEAVSVVAEGIRLAEEAEKERLELIAYGKRLQAKLHCELAEITDSETRKHHLRRAVDCGQAASDLYEVIDAGSSECGAARVTLAQVWYTDYRLSRRRLALNRANKLADQAVGYLAKDRSCEYHDLLILRARISITRGNFPRAKEMVNKALVSMATHAEDGASFAELLGLAHLARAELSSQEGGDDSSVSTRKDIGLALEYFEKSALLYASATCRWRLAKLAPATAGVERADIRICERLFADSRIRMRGLEERSRQIREYVGGRWTRRAEWKEIERKLRSQT